MYETATNKEVPNNANPAKRKILLATSNSTKKQKITPFGCISLCLGGPYWARTSDLTNVNRTL